MNKTTVLLVVVLLSGTWCIIGNTKVFAESDTIVDLNGEWNFCAENGSFKGSGTVPGDIYMDLHQAGIIDEPLYSTNDKATRWVSYMAWIYTKTFVLQQKPDSAILEFDGLDTYAAVTLNSQFVGTTINQFVKYTFDVTKMVSAGSNTLNITFLSPVLTAANEAALFKANYSHVIWPECPPSMYNGECHANMIRKIQASFSWDWGPAFPTVGVWRPIRLIVSSKPRISAMTGTVNSITKDLNDGFMVRIEADVQNALSSTRVAFFFDQLGLIRTVDAGNGKAILETNFTRNQVDLWWPNGHGNQTLYTVTGSITGQSEKTKIRIGFRSVELIQDKVDPNNENKGRHFYFKINGIPIFLKGTNWIPVSSFPAQISNERRYNFLMKSAKLAGINAMRVWGGGRYEEDILYNRADEYGILIWEDLMFACSLYPADPGFLESVTKELEYNVNRLKWHPSMLLWAGNNENELGLNDGWFSGAPLDVMKKEYLQLYKQTAEVVIANLDPGRPFVMSSPSEGIRSIEEGGISHDPNSELFGDIHFYNEFINLWSDDSFRTPRCATEYGVQSFPGGFTLEKYIPADQIYYMSPEILHRQHHPGGTENNLNMIFSHFPLPKECNNTPVAQLTSSCEYVNNSQFMNRFTYYSQAHQSIMYKVQTEHYRRMMGQLDNNGRGNTMCALYWQLNDIWAAPTWASIDTDLRWKMVHYEAKRFFQNLHVVIYLSSNMLKGAIVNDGHSDVTVAVEISMMAWDSNFEPAYTWKQNVITPANKAVNLNIDGKLNQPINSIEDFVFIAKIFDKNNVQIGEDSVVIPQQLYKVNADLYGDIRISSFSQISSTEYDLVISASGISPLTWITVNKPFLGYFSDNAFTMTSKTKNIKLLLEEAQELTMDDLLICNLKNCGLDVPFR